MAVYAEVNLSTCSIVDSVPGEILVSPLTFQHHPAHTLQVLEQTLTQCSNQSHTCSESATTWK
jgi:hypothetical protein